MKKILLACIASLYGCGGPDVYRDESFAAESPFTMKFGVSAQQACEGAQRALLGQGYRIEKKEPDTLIAIKDFQPDEEVSMTLEFNVTCKEDAGNARLFANAVQSRYVLKKSSQSTSLSVPTGSISLPWSKSADSLVKVGSETISDPAFYARFFTLVRTYLGLPKTK